MSEARDFYGKAFQNGSAVFLARLVGPSGAVMLPADVTRIECSVDLLDPHDPGARTPVDGHQRVALSPGAVLFDMLQRDAAWTRDAIGYNFRHELDVSQHEAFALAGRMYLVTYAIMPAVGQRILIRFRVQAI